ncbi:hypothetical protein GWI33_008501 [Rhynchophorus ferrugineus]|uniref:Uncharacterized protein n=1 Tax=Rhynchophorus ferrugineus TaxID=354439 RepID=A0A834MHB4_RHYFE|nr:hypothetical protein GWI33_008501 [Rhynchophorus ferrugineus]
MQENLDSPNIPGQQLKRFGEKITRLAATEQFKVLGISPSYKVQKIYLRECRNGVNTELVATEEGLLVRLIGFTIVTTDYLLENVMEENGKNPLINNSNR